MATTIKKIAELAGVSIGTVDRVINNRGRVSPEVEKRIRKIVEEVGYTPNVMAKSLALKRCSPKIGVVFHVTKASFNEEVKKGIAAAFKEISDFGVEVIHRQSNSFDANDQLRIIDELLEQGVSAIAITPINAPLIVEKIDELLARNYPIFCFMNDVITRQPHVFIGPNAYKTGALAAGLFSLFSQGRRENLAIVTPTLKTLGHIQKIDGFRDTVQKSYPNISLMDICEIPSRLTNDIGVYKVVNQYLDEHPQITALWYATSVSNGGITAIVDHDLLHKVRIVTLDLQPFILQGLQEGYIQATISQNPYQQGFQTLKTVFNSLLFNQYAPSQSVEIPCEVLIRESLAL